MFAKHRFGHLKIGFPGLCQHEVHVDKNLIRVFHFFHFFDRSPELVPFHVDLGDEALLLKVPTRESSIKVIDNYGFLELCHDMLSIPLHHYWERVYGIAGLKNEQSSLAAQTNATYPSICSSAADSSLDAKRDSARSRTKSVSVILRRLNHVLATDNTEDIWLNRMERHQKPPPVIGL
jgi:hypothetical protein